jgi:predicted amidophosphoribosyltransferase
VAAAGRIAPCVATGLHRLLDGIVPPRCAACGGHCPSAGALCRSCTRRLAAAGPLRSAGPPGIDRVWSAAPHDGVARDLVAALKFRRLLPVAGLMAERIDLLAPAWLLRGELVPVPTARLRSLARGFDPADEIAAALAARTGANLRSDCLERRGSPPHFRLRDASFSPRDVVLVDDVLTTGATLSSCARVLRAAGALRVVAVTFSRRP